MKGKFIVLEGIDGSGKTTQALKINDYIFKKQKNYHVLLTREPTECSEYGKEIRKLLKTGKDPRHNKEIFSDLFVKDRKWHLESIIIPNINNGIHVICDRYKCSTLAYQQAQGMPLNTLIDMHNGLLIPDLTLYLDVQVEKALSRTDRGDVFEKIEFQKKVMHNYINLIDMLEDYMTKIDASGNIDSTFYKIKQHLDAIL